MLRGSGHLGCDAVLVGGSSHGFEGSW